MSVAYGSCGAGSKRYFVTKYRGGASENLFRKPISNIREISIPNSSHVPAC